MKDMVRALLAAVVMVGGVVAGVPAARAGRVAPVPATPRGSPGSWLGTSDYPRVALRFDIEGTTGFRLSVDPAGKPVSCEITQSSGFDVLDKATCDRLMANASFTPARDARGNAAAGAYASRVRWQLPYGPAPTIEASGAYFLRIDQAGAVVSCALVVKSVGAEPSALTQGCTDAVVHSILPATAMEMRAGAVEPVVAVQIELATAFSPAMRDRFLAEKSGYGLRSLTVYRLAIGADGKVTGCAMEQQRGNERLIDDFCRSASHWTYQPPAEAVAADGTVTAWHIRRVFSQGAD